MFFEEFFYLYVYLVELNKRKGLFAYPSTVLNVPKNSKINSQLVIQFIYFNSFRARQSIHLELDSLFHA